MPRRRVRLQDCAPPLLLTEAETAHLLGLSASELATRVAAYEARGMPKRHPVFHRRHREALEQWIAREYGLSSGPEARRQALRDRIGAMG